MEFKEVWETIQRQDEEYDVLHDTYYKSKERLEVLSENCNEDEKEHAKDEFKFIQNAFLQNRQETIPTEIWQLIASWLKMNELCVLSAVDKHMYNYVVYGAKFIWKDVVQNKRKHCTYKLCTKEDKPLMIAIQAQNIKLIKILINAKADVNKPLDDFWSPLGLASAYKNSDIVRLLLEQNADPNFIMNDYTPLHNAIEHSKYDNVNILIEAKADVNKMSGNTISNSPLHLACYRNDIRSVSTLLVAKADIFLPDSIGRIAIDYVRSQNVKDLLMAFYPLD